MIASGGSYYKIANGCIDSAGLPVEYQQVEYVESDGNQYIETNFIADQDTSVNVLFKIKHTENLGPNTGSVVYSGAYSYKNRAKEIFTGSNTLVITCGNYFKYFGISTNKRDIFEIENNKNVYTLRNRNTSNSSTITHDYVTFTTPYSIWLFALHRRNEMMTDFFGKGALIYKCSIKDNNTLVRNFIPCYRISDNEIGMYDTVNGVFYTNQGTGTFVKGPNVYNRYIIK